MPFKRQFDKLKSEKNKFFFVIFKSQSNTPISNQFTKNSDSNSKNFKQKSNITTINTDSEFTGVTIKSEKSHMSKLQLEANQIAYELKLQKMKQKEFKSLDDANYQQRMKPSSSSSQLMSRSLLEKQTTKSANSFVGIKSEHSNLSNNNNLNLVKQKKNSNTFVPNPHSFNSLSSVKQQDSASDTIFTPTITPVMTSKKLKPINSSNSNIYNQFSNEGNMSSNRQSSISPSFNINSSKQQKFNSSKASSISPPPRIPTTSASSVATSSSTSISTLGPIPLSTQNTSKSPTMKIISRVVKVNDGGGEMWICPCCNKPDDSIPMIGCDSCDDWYHW